MMHPMATLGRRTKRQQLTVQPRLARLLLSKIQSGLKYRRAPATPPMPVIAQRHEWIGIPCCHVDLNWASAEAQGGADSHGIHTGEV
jgi:hypothetical protein